MTELTLHRAPTCVLGAAEILTPDRVRGIVRDYSYSWDHVLGFLEKPDVLLKDLTSEWACWFRDKVCYDRGQREVLIPKLFKGEAFWCHIPRRQFPHSFIDRWMHMQAIHTGIYVPRLGEGLRAARSGSGPWDPISDMSGAMFSNPNLFKLALRWQNKHTKVSQ